MDYRKINKLLYCVYLKRYKLSGVQWSLSCHVNHLLGRIPPKNLKKSIPNVWSRWREVAAAEGMLRGFCNEASEFEFMVLPS